MDGKTKEDIERFLDLFVKSEDKTRARDELAGIIESSEMRSAESTSERMARPCARGTK